MATPRKENPQKGGRPTKLNDAMLERAAGYLNQCTREVPSFVDFALYLGVTKDTAASWATDKNPEFLCLYEQVRQEQEMKLIDGGLSGDFNPAFAKMLMTKHGYSDRQEIKQEISVSASSELMAKVKRARQRSED